MEEQNPELYSRHFFIFPFKWDSLPADKKVSDLSFEERTRLEDIRKRLSGDSRWQSMAFDIGVDEKDQYHTYNEFTYFHDYVRDILAIGLNNRNDTLQYRYQLPEHGAFYHITTKTHLDNPNNTEPEYSLSIREILLSWFDSGVGYLAFHLDNFQTKKPEDILRINDFGRRIFPQFLGWESPITAAPKGAFLAANINLSGLGIDPEDFSYYETPAQVKGEPVHLPKHIASLLGSDFQTATRYSKQSCPKSYVLITPVIDDRMFVLCHYLSEEKLTPLKDFFAEKQLYGYANNPFWYAFVFVDPSEDINCHSRTMMLQLLNKHTYDRWLEKQQGHLFGISRYSFVLLSDQGWFNENIIANHFRYLYFQLVTLALVQRATLLRFSAEAANISEIVNKQKEDKTQQTKLIRDVYKAYLYFTNKMYFREVTPQEQGIELYDKMREIMEIDTDLQALQAEIHELHQYALLLEEEKSRKESELLTSIANLFLPATIVAAVFGFSNFPIDFNFIQSLKIWIAISVLLSFLAWIGLKAVAKLRRN